MESFVLCTSTTPLLRARRSHICNTVGILLRFHLLINMHIVDELRYINHACTAMPISGTFHWMISLRILILMWHIDRCRCYLTFHPSGSVWPSPRIEQIDPHRDWDMCHGYIFQNEFSLKNIERHTVDTIVSWPNPKQWVIVHISDFGDDKKTKYIYSFNHHKRNG